MKAQSPCPMRRPEPMPCAGRPLNPPESWPQTHAHFAQALRDAAQPTPDDLTAANGSNVGVRLAVYRNNTVLSRVAALAETFEVLRRCVGAAFFEQLALAHVRQQPLRSPVMAEAGRTLPDWLRGFAPAAHLPWLADLARLEQARVEAYHAADAQALSTEALAQALADPATLPELRLALHPSLTVLQARHAVVSLWAIHQQPEGPELDAALTALDIDQPEAALVYRHDDEVQISPVPAADAAFIAALQDGLALGQALERTPPDSLPQALACLIQHGLLVRPGPSGVPLPC